MTVLNESLLSIVEARHHDPFSVLGRHPQGSTTVVRAFLPEAERVWIGGVDRKLPMERARRPDVGLPVRDGPPLLDRLPAHVARPGPCLAAGGHRIAGMADAAEETAGLADGTVRLKWPNDLIVEDGGPAQLLGEPGVDALRVAPTGPRTVRKLGGVLGETDGLGTDDPRVVVGIGVNADWPAAMFPSELAGTMTSLREAAAGRPIDRDLLLEEFLARLEPRILALREGWFDVAGWTERQITTGRTVVLESAGGRLEERGVLGVDALTGALVVADPSSAAGERAVLAGEIVHVRLAGLLAAATPTATSGERV